MAFGVGNPDTTITSTTAINDGEWHHVTATRDGTTGEIKIYIDGNSTPEATGTGSTNTIDVAAELTVGAISGGSNYFTGNR